MWPGRAFQEERDKEGSFLCTYRPQQILWDWLFLPTPPSPPFLAPVYVWHMLYTCSSYPLDVVVMSSLLVNDEDKFIGMRWTPQSSLLVFHHKNPYKQNPAVWLTTLCWLQFDCDSVEQMIALWPHLRRSQTLLCCWGGGGSGLRGTGRGISLGGTLTREEMGHRGMASAILGFS